MKVSTVALSIIVSCTSDSTYGTEPIPQSVDKAITLPVTVNKAGVENVTLFRVYKVTKWDLGRQAPNYYPQPEEGVELFVVRFYRQAVKPEIDLPRHAVSLVDLADQPLHRNEVLWRIVPNQWAEWVFVARRGTQLKKVVINGTEFDLRGYKVIVEDGPSDK